VLVEQVGRCVGRLAGASVIFFILTLLKNFFTNRSTEKQFSYLDSDKGPRWTTGRRYDWHPLCTHGPSLATVECRASMMLAPYMSFLPYLFTGPPSSSSPSHSFLYFNTNLSPPKFCPFLDLTL
jgi:hypothetical protein